MSYSGMHKSKLHEDLGYIFSVTNTGCGVASVLWIVMVAIMLQRFHTAADL